MLRKPLIPSVAIALCVAVALCGTGCEPGPKSAHGFTLPDGDPKQGLTNFTDYGCHGCHSIPGVDLPPLVEKSEYSVQLGGTVSRIKTYGELVTSIINPTHRMARNLPVEKVSFDGESIMPVYNDVLTVRELIDLVAFLQSHYEVEVPRSTYYPPY